MKAIVHIGSPKTGSSTLQNFLNRNAKRLAERGVRFRRNVPKRGSQWEIPLGILSRTGGALRTKVDRIRYEARTPEEQHETTAPHLEAIASYPDRFAEPVAVFSSEHILPWLDTPETVRALDAFLSDTFEHVRYVAYFRAPVDSLPSSYSERIKRGRQMTLDEFIELRLPSLGIHKAAARWRDTVGADRLSVRLFDRRYLHNGDLIDDFCAEIGVAPDELDRPPRRNESLTSVGAEVLRMLNGCIPEIHSEGGINPLRKGLVPAVQRITADAPAIRLSAEQLRRVVERTAEDNDRFRRAFFPAEPELFSTAGYAVSQTDTATLREEALAAMATIVAQLRLDDIPPLTAPERKHAQLSGLARAIATRTTAAKSVADEQKQDQQQDTGA